MIDTDVFSYVFNRHSSAGPYTDLIGGRKSAICFITLGEILAGARLKAWGAPKQHKLEIALTEYAILESNRFVAEHYASLTSFLRIEGRPLSANDAWIAATAISYGLPLVSNNRSHFERVPCLELISFAP